MDPIKPLIDALHDEGRLRVWSLVITAFGDLVQHRGGRISTTRLGLLLGRIGIEKGTLRTALSRLGNDGWVQRERAGRTSIYRLSEQGLNSFGAATALIYAPPRTGPVTEWAVSMTLDPQGIAKTALTPADRVQGASDCRVVGRLDHVSEIYRNAALSAAHRGALEALARDLGALSAPVADPLDAAAARMLLIHRWRRIVLRFSELPAELMPDDTPLRDPRGAVASAYARLTPTAEAWLDLKIDGLKPLPSPHGSTRNRFGTPLQG